MKDKLDTVSPTFCIAKWKQSTIYLQTGQTHSCHHPSTHSIYTEELSEDPSALHNTGRKVDFRRELLRGEQSQDCNYCWKMEALGKESDRIHKSNEPWAAPYFEEARDNLRVNPSYLEISFDSTCNLKCAYCGPALSTKWQSEVNQWGAYPNGYQNPEFLKSIGRWPQLNREHNPYKEAFWQWWPDLYPDLSVFRITGGEPLLSKDTWRVFDWILDNPRTDLTVSVNTNLCVSQSLIQQLLDYGRKMQNKVQSFQIFTSGEAWGAQCEYIRYPMDFDEFWQNFYIISQQLPDVTMTSTVNLLSMETLPKMIEQGLIWDSCFDPYSPQFSLPVLQEPRFLDPRLAPNETKRRFSREMQNILTNLMKDSRNFERMITEIDRTIAYINEPMPQWDTNIDSFRMFIREYDRRRSTDFGRTFPELNKYIKVYNDD